MSITFLFLQYNKKIGKNNKGGKFCPLFHRDCKSKNRDVTAVKYQVVGHFTFSVLAESETDMNYRHSKVCRLRDSTLLFVLNAL